MRSSRTIFADGASEGWKHGHATLNDCRKHLEEHAGFVFVQLANRYQDVGLDVLEALRMGHITGVEQLVDADAILA
jgi:hypothetical protein